MDVGVNVAINFAADLARVAAIRRDTAGFDRLLAIQRFGQRAGERFQFLQPVAGEKVGMAEPPAGELALQQLHALRVPGKKGEGHCVRGQLCALRAAFQVFRSRPSPFKNSISCRSRGNEARISSGTFTSSEPPHVGSYF